MQIHLKQFIARSWSSWRRAVGGVVSQQALLFFSSILTGALSVYTSVWHYAGYACLAVAAAALTYGNPTSCPVGSICVIALSMIALQPRLLPMHLYTDIRDMYVDLYGVYVWLRGLTWYPLRDALRGHVLRESVALMLTHAMILSMHLIPVFSQIPADGWHYIVVALPVVPFMCCSLLDTAYTPSAVWRAFVRAVRLVWYQAPLCIAGTGCVVLWIVFVRYIPYGYIAEYATIPLWLSMWYTIYLKAIYEQFHRYYPDMYACDTNSA